MISSLISSLTLFFTVVILLSWIILILSDSIDYYGYEKIIISIMCGLLMISSITGYISFYNYKNLKNDYKELQKKYLEIKSDKNSNLEIEEVKDE